MTSMIEPMTRFKFLEIAASRAVAEALSRLQLRRFAARLRRRRGARKVAAVQHGGGGIAKLRMLVCLVAASAAGFAYGQGQTPQALLHYYKCYLCHADTETKVGPAYVDIAARYQGNSQAMPVLIAAVRNGAHGSGPWHMPPHPEVSTGDAATMVRYILSVKP
jgi:cytochrome c551/c552